MENLYTIEQVFSEKLFRVPDYQRGYAWGTQQCQEFIEDLELLEPGKKHFLGTLILHGRGSTKIIDRSGNSYTEYNVVDGQQRLTTIVIFLQVISQRMALTEDAHDLAAGLQQKYIVCLDRNKRPLPKLSLNEDSRAFFNQAILGQGAQIQGPTILSITP